MMCAVCSTEHNQHIISDTFVLFKNVGDNEGINRSSITEIAGQAIKTGRCSLGCYKLKQNIYVLTKQCETDNTGTGAAHLH